MKAIIARQDLLGNPAVFLPETADKEMNKIQFWNGKHGAQPQEATLDYYRSTKAIENKEQLENLVKGFSNNFGDKEIVVRQRLLKDRTGQVVSNENFDPQAYKQKLLKAIEKAIMEV